MFGNIKKRFSILFWNQPEGENQQSEEGSGSDRENENENENENPSPAKLVELSNSLENVYYSFYYGNHLDKDFKKYKKEKQYGLKKLFFLNLMSLNLHLLKEVNEEKVVSLVNDILDHIKYKSKNQELLNFIYQFYNYLFFFKDIGFQDDFFVRIFEGDYDTYLKECAESYRNKIETEETDDLEIQSDPKKALSALYEAYGAFYMNIRASLPEPFITRISRVRVAGNGLDLSSIDTYVFDLPPQKFFYYDDADQMKKLEKNIQLPPPQTVNRSNRTTTTTTTTTTTRANTNNRITGNNSIRNSNNNSDNNNSNDNNNNKSIKNRNNNQRVIDSDSDSDASDVDSCFEDDSNYVNKDRAVGKGEWSEEECNRLARGLVVFDNKWVKIANTYLRGLRSAQQIKDKCKGMNKAEFIQDYLTTKQISTCEKLKDKFKGEPLKKPKLKYITQKRREYNREKKRKQRERKKEDEANHDTSNNNRGDGNDNNNVSDSDNDNNSVNISSGSVNNSSDENDDVISKHVKDIKKKKSEKKINKRKQSQDESESSSEEEEEEEKRKKRKKSKSKSKSKSEDEVEEIMVSD